MSIALVLGVILIIALMIPLAAIIMDSPVGQVLARRLERGGPPASPDLDALARKVELLEAEVEELSGLVQTLKEENEFFQRLLEDPSTRPALPRRDPP